MISNIVFFASICLTIYSLVAESKPPLNVSLAASGFLLAVKVIVDWTARKKDSRGPATR